MIWKNFGALFEGWFENDKMSGQGRYMTKEANSEGEFFNNKMNGHGNNIHSFIHSLQRSSRQRMATPTTGIIKMVICMEEVSSSRRMATPTTGIGKMVKDMEEVS